MAESVNKLIKTSFDFIDIETGEIIAKGCQRTPLNLCEDRMATKYVASLLRGLKAKKNVALNILIAPSEHKPTELKIQFDFLEPVHLDEVLP